MCSTSIDSDFYRAALSWSERNWIGSSHVKSLQGLNITADGTLQYKENSVIDVKLSS